MAKTTVIIDGEKYQKQNTDGEKLCICIVDNRGLTFIGYIDPTKINSTEGLQKIRAARCIRRWGTDRHLAQLASEGAQTNTKLDAQMDVFVDKIIAMYICNSEKWSNYNE